MTTTNYILLTTSDYLVSLRFKATQWNPGSQKRQTITQTAGGLSIVSGTPIKIVQFVLKTAKAVLDFAYGTLDELETFFNLNNPSGTPSSIITYTDFYGVSYLTEIIGEFKPQPLTNVIEGAYAPFLVPLSLLIISEVSS